MNNEKLKKLKQSLAKARQRASYWSGRPSHRGYGFAVNKESNQTGSSLKYELALDDCHAIADQIEEITGKRPKVTDYKDEYNEKFCTHILPLITGNN